ncbi:hypothetical protein C8J57DRAFT_1521140 [Mycena rebaudengoi]|nr:hypothetical protein C8J57DRAFT_1521140 [Mycena rebaudengoi]
MALLSDRGRREGSSVRQRGTALPTLALCLVGSRWPRCQVRRRAGGRMGSEEQAGVVSVHRHFEDDCALADVAGTARAPWGLENGRDCALNEPDQNLPTYSPVAENSALPVTGAASYDTATAPAHLRHPVQTTYGFRDAVGRVSALAGAVAGFLSDSVRRVFGAPAQDLEWIEMNQLP